MGKAFWYERAPCSKSKEVEVLRQDTVLEEALESVVEPTEVEGEIHECIIGEESKFEPKCRSLEGRTPTGSCVGE